MTKIRITSDPYQQQISFEMMREGDGQWNSVNALTCPDSRLLNDSLVSGFFPFQIRDILNILLEDYSDASGGDDARLELVFQGTDDEYHELKFLVQSEDFKDRVVLEQSGRYLKNARDILPDIRNLFSELKPEIQNSEICDASTRQQMDLIANAASEQIPVVVFGTYSTGKSTFINAILGQEFLPANDKPTTAFVAEIKNSRQKDTAKVTFAVSQNLSHGEGTEDTEVEEDTLSLRFRVGSPVVADEGTDTKPDNEVFERVLEEPADLIDGPLSARVCRTLEILNSLKKDFGDRYALNPVVNIEIPYAGKMDSSFLNQLVFFDTPGSNTASNQDHIQAMNKEMSSMSNGLTVVVGSYDTMDTNDNSELAQNINDIQAVDSRFTVLVLNQADKTDLESVVWPDDLRQDLPSRLNTRLVYFISSIMGLGSQVPNARKKLRNRKYREIYCEQEDKYSNPDNDFYKQLYLYDYLPDQIKKRSDEKSAMSDKRIYANSGMLSLSLLLEDFAEKYAAYNKSLKASSFIKSLIDKAGLLIESKKEEKNRIKKNLLTEFKNKQQQLRDAVEAEANDFFDDAIVDYSELLGQASENAQCPELSREEISAKLLEFARELDEMQAQEQKPVQTEKLAESEKPTWESLLNGAAEFIGGVSQKISNSKAIVERTKVYISETLPDAFEVLTNQTRQESMSFWNGKTGELKKRLMQCVTESESLEEEEKEVLQETIQYFDQKVDYRQIESEPFNKEKSAEWLSIIDGTFSSISSLGNAADQVKKWQGGALAKSVQKSVKTKHVIYADNLKNEHPNAFKKWEQSLREDLDSKMVTLNPTLQDKNALIEDKNREIERLKEISEHLQDAARTLDLHLGWH